MSDYYKIVPKGLKDNLKFREELLTKCLDGGPAAQEELWIACKRDLLFYVNTMCWTYDPRKTKCLL